ncbi:hypothetical protein PENSOL_c024G05374 [Penicillium solitum]|uniref:Uncharacterized protein n=1 Tax=Penicillium solitum TaxID=60172 RepID=A0A1V6QZZ7_9EURO|nr:hypothetical protein PENSOL_c024G05374 [Penicillium solitum]
MDDNASFISRPVALTNKTAKLTHIV